MTLELGGKSPVDRGRERRSARRPPEHIIWGKLRERRPDLHRPGLCVRASRRRATALSNCVAAPSPSATATATPRSKSSPDFPRMIHRRHAERVAHLIDDAVQSGSQVACGGIIRRRCALCRTNPAEKRAAGCTDSQGRDFRSGFAHPHIRFSSTPSSPRSMRERNRGWRSTWSKSERTVQALETNT